LSYSHTSDQNAAAGYHLSYSHTSDQNAAAGYPEIVIKQI
jgi:hypothetical protein